jgi:type VI secretion system protein ImpB
MGKESVQQKLTKVRAPRVKITYDVQVGDAQEVKELPFVMGVLGDLTGQPENPMAPLKERPFVEIGPDNFDDVLKGMAPHLRFSVTNKLSSEPDARQVGVDLKFEKVDDFSPAAVARQVEPLKQLLDLRTRLSDLRGSLQGNDQLDQALFDAVSKTEELAKLRSEFESRKPEESK